MNYFKRVFRLLSLPIVIAYNIAMYGCAGWTDALKNKTIKLRDKCKYADAYFYMYLTAYFKILSDDFDKLSTAGFKTDKDQEREDELRKARQQYNTILVRAPHLGKDLQPLIELVDQSTCPGDKRKKCHDCKHFMGIYTEEEAIFAHMVFEGFCSFGRED